MLGRWSWEAKESRDGNEWISFLQGERVSAFHVRWTKSPRIPSGNGSKTLLSLVTFPVSFHHVRALRETLGQKLLNQGARPRSQRVSTLPKTTFSVGAGARAS